MSIHFEQLYDIISLVRIKAYEDELSIDQAFDLLEKELSDVEYDD